MKRPVTLALSLLLVLIGYGKVPAAPDDWAEGTPGHNDGATRSFYNRGAQLTWRHSVGDWRDADGVSQGDRPFATTTIDVAGPTRVVEWDVTSLVREWFSGKSRNKGILLRGTDGKANCRFHSREADEAANYPRLVLTVDGGPREFVAVADTYLDRSTYRSLGERPHLTVAGEMPALIRFDLNGLKATNRIDQATLRLVTFKQYAAGDVGVFACDQGEDIRATEPLLGLAAKYPGDRGISQDPDVLFATGFEAEDWRQEWTSVGGDVETLIAHPENDFEPLAGRACRVRLAQGALTAMNQTYKFRKEHGFEPEEVYFRYYLRFGDDWQQTVQGGKMPGLSGTYGRAGWGGRKVDGTDGWSARGSFGLTLPEGNPLAGKHPLGFYCYHADMSGNYGNIWVWTNGYRGFLANNRWYCVEQFVKLNTPGRNGKAGQLDGVLRAWIDGRLAFEKTDIRFRDVDRLKIEQIWMNVYHGGTKPSPHEQHLYVDNVVVARRYIGPMPNATPSPQGR